MKAARLYVVRDLRVEDVADPEPGAGEALACIVQAHSYTQIGLGEDVVIVGAGPIGLLHLQVALQRGGRVIVSDPLAARLEKARELGAHDVIDATTTDPVARVKELTRGRG